MAKKTTKKSASTEVSDYSMQHEFSRTKLPTGEYSGISPKDLTGMADAPTVKYSLDEGATDLTEEFAARDPDLDPQYVWRGKRKGDLNELEVKAPIIYQQEKIFPRMLIEEMKRRSAIRKNAVDVQMMLGEGVEDFDPNAQPGFYNHEEGWKNRMILGDSLQVMASLAENESLRGKVQMVYFDPPYGIKFNSNWQPTTKSTNVKDGSKDDITREPEMVKAFRDTWHDGIHSYLGYLRDRLTVARDLLTTSGSCFVQISDENVHKVRVVMDEVFGEENFIGFITFRKKNMPLGAALIEGVSDYLVWYARDKINVKYRKLFQRMNTEGDSHWNMLLGENGELRKLSSEEIQDYNILPPLPDLVQLTSLCPAGMNASGVFPFAYNGTTYNPPAGKSWKTNPKGMERLFEANRIFPYSGGATLRYVLRLNDYPVSPLHNLWFDTAPASNKSYVCQTAERIIQRCILMCTDPGDLVLDPTCGSGTTASVAEQWGRRWITIDTSRVALALARTRIMTTKYPYYLLSDSEMGIKKEMEITGKAIVRDTFNKISQGFVYERVPHITLKTIANDAEIDIIWQKYEDNSRHFIKEMGVSNEWEVPVEAPESWDERHREYLLSRL